MLYEWLKFVHIISASVLFGSGIGTAFYMFLANIRKDKDIEVIARATKRVVRADWYFTGTSGVLQPLTGFSLLYLKHFSFTASWALIVVGGYVIAGVCWFIVVYLQIQCYRMAVQAVSLKTELPRRYYGYFFSWLALGVPAFSALLVVLFFMANSPFSA